MATEELIEEPRTKVRVSAGLTIQLAPYNTARVQLDMEEACLPSDANDVLDDLYQLLEDALVEKLRKLQQRAYDEGLVR